MIDNIVVELTRVLKMVSIEDEKAFHESIADLMKDNDLVWRKEYTIAVSKDDRKRKITNFMVCNKLDEKEQTFKVKREKDYWKKLEPREDYEAVVECSLFLGDVNICSIESVGRDIMRSRKEVPTVGFGGFVWVVAVNSNIKIDTLFSLYFKENVSIVERGEVKYYIGWTDKLKTLDMRNFICDPITKKML